MHSPGLLTVAGQPLTFDYAGFSVDTNNSCSYSKIKILNTTIFILLLKRFTRVKLKINAKYLVFITTCIIGVKKINVKMLADL